MRVPIVMESELAEAKRKLEIIKEREERRVHLDVGDGLFSEMWSVSPADLTEVKMWDLEVHVHLLVDDPSEWIEECKLVKPSRVIGQIERMGNQELFLEKVRKIGSEGGLALKIETPVESIKKEVLTECKVVLLLSVPAGTSGSEFDKRVIDKIKELRERYLGKILVDGGITPIIEKQVVEAGADEVAANSAYWRGEWR